MVQLKIIQDLRKQKSDLTYPIYFRLTEYNRSIYLSSGYSINKEHWDKQACKVVKNHPNAAVINANLSKRYFEIQKVAIKLEDEGRFTFSHLKEMLGDGSRRSVVTVKEFTDGLIADMLKQRKVGNAVVYQSALNALSHFKSSNKLIFTDITLKFLEDYHIYLITRDVKINTISNYMRTLRAIYNKALRAKLVERKHYPFNDFTIKNEQTTKRAITKGDIVNIENYDVNNQKPLEQAKDLFLLSFYLIGISFVDMAYLTRDNIVDGRVVYRRKKTGKLYNIKLFPKAMIIINKYKRLDAKYLLPIFSDGILEDSLDSHKAIRQSIKTTNKYLGRLCELIPLTTSITTYVARHTFATLAKRLGYSNEMIAESLGHEYGNRTTAIYLDAFDKKEIDKMHSIVIG